MDPTTTVIIGRGRVGRGLYRLLRRQPGVWRLSEGRHSARRAIGAADVVVLAVPDPAIREVAERITPWLRPRSCVLHCAGSRTAE